MGSGRDYGPDRRGGVELSYIDANNNTTYDPNNVENATISVSPSDPSEGC